MLIYYWYDEDGNVMYYTGYEDVYIGLADVFYIDENGHLCEYYKSFGAGFRICSVFMEVGGMHKKQRGKL